MKEIKLEFLKSRGRGLGLIVLAMMGVSLLWIIWAFRNPDEKDIEWGWMLILYNLPLLRAIVFPAVAAVIASKLSDLEHKSGCLRSLETMQKPGALYRAKFVCGSTYVLGATALELAVMLIMGRAYGFQGQPELRDFALNFIIELVTGLEAFSISLALSMNIKNQAVPFCIGVGGSFVGLMLTLLPQLDALRLLLPWAHISALMFIGMDWSKAGGFAGMYRLYANWTAFVVTVAYILLVYIIGQRRFRRMEV